MSRVWFITGCSTGIGRLLAERVHRDGDSVVATARSVEALAALGTEDEGRILRCTLDVKRPGDIADAVAQAMERFGHIDVLVNNAGYGYFSTQEEAHLDDVRDMYETNVFGLIAMTQAVLPSMRERRSGTIVNLSSMAGHMGTPRGGFYQSTKWAVEALSEALHMETVDHGLRVVVVEPGRYETQFSSSARPGPRELDSESPYAEQRVRWGERGLALFPDSQDPDEVIDATCAAVDGQQSFVRVPVGTDATMVIERRDEIGNQAFVEWMREQMGS